MSSPPLLPRRAALRGAGALLALPFLEALAPRAAPPPTRLLGIELVHGAAGSTAIGRARNLWAPARTGPGLEPTPALQALAPLLRYVTVVSGCALRAAMTLSAEEDGMAVDHARASAAFLTAAHPRRSAEGPWAGPSVDQLYARRLRGATRVGSLQLSVEDPAAVDDLAWPSGYDPSYRQAISWADARTPLIPEHRPRAVFARLFGRPPGADASVLDPVRADARTLRGGLGPADTRRLDAYLERVRGAERQIDALEAAAGAGEPPSFPAQLAALGELIALAFEGDVTRVATLKLGLDRSPRVYPESGLDTPFHALSHHREEPERVEAFNRLNAWHVGQVAGVLAALAQTPEGEADLLEHTVALCGSPMGDSHVHGHEHLPLFVAGRAGGRIGGDRHLACADGTPLANVLLSVLQTLGAPDHTFGDSTGTVAL